MDALHTRGDITTSAQELATPHATVAPLRPERGLGRAWLATSLATVGLAAAAWFNFVQMPVPIVVGHAVPKPLVESVGVGSWLWQQGIRPLMPVAHVDDGSSLRVAVPGGLEFTFPLFMRGDFLVAFGLGFALVIAAGLFGWGRLPGAAAAAGAGVAIALGPALPQIGFPGAIPLVLLSAGTALAAVKIPDRRGQRTFDAFGLGALGIVLLAAFVLMRNPEPVNWAIVWAAPLAIAVVIAVFGEALAIRARLRRAPVAGLSRMSRLLAAIVPLAANSRLEGADDERSRLAIELHNRVLPKVHSSARAIRDERSLDEAADRLEGLAAELREVMQSNETVTLEIGGLADALRVHLDAIDSAGIRITFEVRSSDARRPPPKVELAAYRIGQAAIDNAIRHAGAERIDVSVATGAERIDVVVRDDGVGIDSTAEEHARRRGRLGVAQMRLRADAAGGSLKIDGRAGQGTEVRFTWAG